MIRIIFIVPALWLSRMPFVIRRTHVLLFLVLLVRVTLMPLVSRNRDEEGHTWAHNLSFIYISRCKEMSNIKIIRLIILFGIFPFCKCARDDVLSVLALYSNDCTTLSTTYHLLFRVNTSS